MKREEYLHDKLWTEAVVAHPRLKSNYHRWLAKKGRKREAEFVESASVQQVVEFCKLRSLTLEA